MIFCVGSSLKVRREENVRTNVVTDLRVALRSLVRVKGLAITVIVVMAIGVYPNAFARLGELASLVS